MEIANITTEDVGRMNPPVNINAWFSNEFPVFTVLASLSIFPGVACNLGATSIFPAFIMEKA